MLAGPAKVRDSRITPVRGDLADIALAGRIFVPHYVVPLERAVAAPFVALRRAAQDEAEQVSELLEGERFMVLDLAGAWAWGYAACDGYVGYLRADPLEEPDDVRPRLAVNATDPVAAAEALVGTPYVWGGRGGAGVDCSGLVQTAFASAGHKLPRDSDQQAATGRALAPGEAPRRGDLVFFPRHVGMLRDGEHLIHASQERGRVLVEPLADIVASRGPVLQYRRIG